MGDRRLLVEGWRGISHSWSIVNQNQLLVWSRQPGLQVFHRDARMYLAHWNSTAHGAGFGEDQAARLRQIPPPDGEPVDAVYRISYPTPPPSALRGNPPQFSFLVTEMGPKPRDFDAALGRPASLTGDGNAVITPSNWSRERLVAHGLAAERVHVVPHGVALQTFRPLADDERQARRRALGFEAGDFVFANIGVATWNKGLDLLMLAFARVRQRHPQARLLLKNQLPLYGVSAEPIVRAVARKHPALFGEDLMDSVFVINDNLDQAQMRELYACVDCYVSPYRAEGFNLPVLEAMACGTPAVVTAGGATDDFCDGPWVSRVAGCARTTPDDQLRGGRYIEVDGEALVDAMARRLLAASAEQRAQGPAWAAWRQRMSWDHAARRALDICLGAPSVPRIGADFKPISAPAEDPRDLEFQADR